MGWNVTDVNRETDRREDGYDDAAARTVLCLSRFSANVGQRRDCGRGQCEVSDCLRTVCAHRQCLFANCCVSCAFADADCLLPRLLAWTGRGRGLFADVDKLASAACSGPVRARGIAVFVDVSDSYRVPVLRMRRDCLADLETFATKG